jgi:peptide methionine sulfoxide reductase msrA/msrB
MWRDKMVFYRKVDMYKKLTPAETQVIANKATERPFSGKYDKFNEQGIYACKRCGARLYQSDDKFDAGCGWPSFDDEIADAVKRTPDADGRRTEITCAKCGGHLGHVFLEEGHTAKNTRHCVNSISLEFIPSNKETARAIFASGCFWGTEYHFKKAPGVLSTQVGFTGGQAGNPTYEQVCTGTTGHAEAVEVVYDPTQTDYDALARLYFETHDPTQSNGQGPDIGTQYRSAIFHQNDEQKEAAEQLINVLKAKGYDVKTELVTASQFWTAEEYHQDYYGKTGKTPYCHIYKKLF